MIKNPIATHLLALSLGGGLMFAASYRYATESPPALTPPAKVLTKVERVTVPCETVQVYKPEAKRKISLPEAVRKNPKAHVVASSDVPATDRDKRLSTVLDTETGAVDTYTEVLAAPWLRPEARGEVGLYAGIKPGQPGMTGRLQARYDVLQIKGAHVGAIGSLDSDGETFAGVGLSYRW